MEPTEITQTRRIGYVYFGAFVAAVGGFLFGFDLSIISGAMIFLKSEFALTEAQFGFAVSSALIGCIAGPLFGHRLSDILGRKVTLAVCAILFGISAVGTALPQNMIQFNIFRIIGGLAVGLAAIVSPMYIAELAPARIRGRLVNINQLAIGIGALTSIIVGWLLAKYMAAENAPWRWMFASELVPIVLLLIGLIFVPRSPRWLVMTGKFEQAREILTKIDGPAHADTEMKEISQSIRKESGSFSELFQPGIRIALIIAVALAIFQPASGAGTLIYYAPVIFQKAGFESADSAIFQTVLINIAQLIAAFTAVMLVDKVGRKPLYIVGTAGMAITMAAVGIFFQFNMPGKFILVAMFLNVGAYLISLAPLTWLIMSEVFPTRVRARGMAIAGIILWTSTFTVNLFYPRLVEYIEVKFGTNAIGFYLFTVFCLVALVFGWLVIPELKGKTLEQISDNWRKKSV